MASKKRPSGSGPPEKRGGKKAEARIPRRRGAARALGIEQGESAVASDLIMRYLEVPPEVSLYIAHVIRVFRKAFHVPIDADGIRIYPDKTFVLRSLDESREMSRAQRDRARTAQNGIYGSEEATRIRELLRRLKEVEQEFFPRRDSKKWSSDSRSWPARPMGRAADMQHKLLTGGRAVVRVKGEYNAQKRTPGPSSEPGKNKGAPE